MAMGRAGSGNGRRSFGSRTRRLMDEATHQEVLGWVLRQLARAGLPKGKTIGIDATTRKANAAMKSITRRDTEER
jgi:hypothetical protein